MTSSAESVMAPSAELMSPSNAFQYQSRNHDVRSRLDVTHRLSVSLRASTSRTKSNHWSNTDCFCSLHVLAYALDTSADARR